MPVDQRAERGDDFVIDIYVEDDEGELKDADGDVTVTVTDEDGSQTHSDTLTTSVQTGIYQTIHPAHSDLELLDVDVSYTVDGLAREEQQTVEVVGQRLAPLHRYRSRIDEERSEYGAASIATRDLERVAIVVEDWFDDALRYSPFVRGSTVEFYLRGGRMHVPGIPYPRTIVSAEAFDANDDKVTGFDKSKLRLRGHNLEDYKGGSLPSYYVRLKLEHGRWQRPIPADLERAAAQFAEYVAEESDLPARAERVSQADGGLISLATPSPQRPTGIPEVDGVVRRYRLPTL